jgi:hypothetical protein
MAILKAKLNVQQIVVVMAASMDQQMVMVKAQSVDQ